MQFLFRDARNPLDKLDAFRAQLFTYIERNQGDQAFLKDILESGSRARVYYADEYRVLGFKNGARGFPDKRLEDKDLNDLELGPIVEQRFRNLASELGFVFKLTKMNYLKHFFTLQTIVILSEKFYFHELFPLTAKGFLGLTKGKHGTIRLCLASFKTPTAQIALDSKFPPDQLMYYFTDEEATHTFKPFLVNELKYLFRINGFGCALRRIEYNHLVSKNNGLYYLIAYPTLATFYKCISFVCFDAGKLRLNGLVFRMINHNNFLERQTVLMNNEAAQKVRVHYDLRLDAIMSEPLNVTFTLQIGMLDIFQGKMLSVTFYDGTANRAIAFRKFPHEPLYTGCLDDGCNNNLLASPFHPNMPGEQLQVNPDPNKTLPIIEGADENLLFIVETILMRIPLNDAFRARIEELTPDDHALAERYINSRMFPTPAHSEFHILGIGLNTARFMKMHYALLEKCTEEFGFPALYETVLRQAYEHAQQGV